MYLKNAISISLAITALLSIFMLQMGSDEETSFLLPIFAIPVVFTGVWLVDFKKKFALTEGWSNVLIILAVLVHLGGLFQSASAFLAYSIANILVWVQLVLFYRRKDVMILYQLLILSFVQGGVACVFQQNTLFLPLLLAFSFSILCSVSLLFLNQERVYYQTHAFLKPAFGGGEKVKRVTVGHLLVLAVKTAAFLPLMTLFGYRWKEFFGDDDSRPQLVAHRHSDSPASGGGSMGDSALFDFWETDRRETAPPKDSDGTLFSVGRAEVVREQAATVGLPLRTSGGSAVERRLRWPLLRRIPLFSGARQSDEGILIDRRILSRLFWGALFSLTAAAVVFFFFPRFNDVEFGDVRFGHDQWRGAPPAVRSVVGFNETVHLGEMGPSGTNFESVMRLELTDIEQPERPAAADGEPIYLRGTILMRYENGSWSRSDVSGGSQSFSFVPRSDRFRENLNAKEDTQRKPGCLFSGREETYLQAVFDHRNALVRQNIRLYPMTTPVIFTVWPFFQIGDGIGMFDGERYIRSNRDSTREMSFSLYTNAFRDGRQMEMTPAQENFSSALRLACLQIDRRRLPELIRRAEDWDAQGNFPKNDSVSRAKNLERKFRESEQYRYSRSGMLRNSELDPLEDFISVHRSGHCEYFAGALAMMLRSIGIPSRVVVGFCCSYRPESDGAASVRQSDAHTWVEAYIPPNLLPAETFDMANESEKLWWSNGGWLRLDAVPAPDSELIRSVSINFYAWRDALRRWWNDYVLNYSGGRQREAVYQPVGRALFFFWEKTSDTLARLNPFDREKERFEQTDGETANYFRWTVILQNLTVAALLIFAALMLPKAARRYFRTRRTERREQYRAQVLAVGFFQRLTRILLLNGLSRSDTETPREFVGRFLASPNDRAAIAALLGEPAGAETVRETERFLAEMVRSIVEVYYRVRFGGGGVEAQEKARFDEFFLRVEKNIPSREKKSEK